MLLMESLQKSLLSITNTNEGVIFVNQTNPITNISLYAGTLFPKFGPKQDSETAKLYASLGTPLEQDEAIMAECKCDFWSSHLVYCLSVIC